MELLVVIALKVLLECLQNQGTVPTYLPSLASRESIAMMLPWLASHDFQGFFLIVHSSEMH